MKTKRQQYITAVADISCARIKKGERVSVEWSHSNPDGIHWYKIRKTESRDIQTAIAYPEHHLRDLLL